MSQMYLRIHILLSTYKLKVCIGPSVELPQNRPLENLPQPKSQKWIIKKETRLKRDLKIIWWCITNEWTAIVLISSMYRQGMPPFFLHLASRSPSLLKKHTFCCSGYDAPCDHISWWKVYSTQPHLIRLNTILSQADWGPGSGLSFEEPSGPVGT